MKTVEELKVGDKVNILLLDRLEIVEGIVIQNSTPSIYHNVEVSYQYKIDYVNVFLCTLVFQINFGCEDYISKEYNVHLFIDKSKAKAMLNQVIYERNKEILDSIRKHIKLLGHGSSSYTGFKLDIGDILDFNNYD